MDYKKKSLSELNKNKSYEEIDTRLASGWYVDSVENNKKKKYRTKKVSFKISKKIWSTNYPKTIFKLEIFDMNIFFECITLETGTNFSKL